MLYDIQAVERTEARNGKRGIPHLVTDMVTSDKRRIFERVKELNGRRQQCRVIPQYGPELSVEEIKDLNR